MERLVRVLFIGNDWAEDHHDIDGITRLHALVAQHAPPGWA
jgi:hypothetical protein